MCGETTRHNQAFFDLAGKACLSGEFNKKVKKVLNKPTIKRMVKILKMYRKLGMDPSIKS